MKRCLGNMALTLRTFPILLCTVISLAAKTESRNTHLLHSLQKVTVSTWVSTCIQLNPQEMSAACCSSKNMLDALQTYSAQSKALFSSLTQQKWVEHEPATVKKFQPFTQKLVIPAHSTVYLWGDLHGDVQALARSIALLHEEGILNDQFKIIAPNNYLLFLGDYTDRGQYGAEVIYTLMRLKIANPDTVILIRGNHEDPDLNDRFGFFGELQRKFPRQAAAIAQTCTTMYNSLPVVLFLGTQDAHGGCNYLQCCHGGMEIGYHPEKLFALPSTVAYERIIELPRMQNLKKLKPHVTLAQQQFFLGNTIPSNYFYHVTKSELDPAEIGFMWNDFSATGDTTLSWYNKERHCGLCYGQNLTETIVRWYNAHTNHTICGCIRAHQHNPSMPGLFHNHLNKGLYKLPWQIPIFTTVATQQYTPGLCTFLKVTTAAQFSDWTMTRIHCTKDGAWAEVTDTVECY